MNTELMLSALADAEKFWLHKRRQVKSGECDLYNEEFCTRKMKEYHAEWERLYV